MPPESDAEFKRALAVALRMLRARDRFEAEVRARCASKAFTDAVIEPVVAFLKQMRFLDDERLSKHLANLWTQEKCWPPPRVAAELERRGAPSQCVESALQELPDEVETARRFAQTCRLGKSDLMKRLTAAGFSQDAIESAIAYLPVRT